VNVDGMAEVEAYEESKRQALTADQYIIPAWYSRSFLWLWPWVVVGGSVLAIQSRYGHVGLVSAWWLGLLVFTAAFVRFFQRLG
jgi:hypothetical protein